MAAEGCLLPWYAPMALPVAARGTVQEWPLVWRAPRGGGCSALLGGVPPTAIMLAAFAMFTAREELLLSD